MGHLKEVRLLALEVIRLQIPISENSGLYTGAQQQMMHAVDCMAAHKPITAVVTGVRDGVSMNTGGFSHARGLTCVIRAV